MMRTLLACCFLFTIGIGCSSSEPTPAAGRQEKGMHLKGEHKGDRKGPPGGAMPHKGEHRGEHKTPPAPGV
jgi:hypothetical protein